MQVYIYRGVYPVYRTSLIDKEKYVACDQFILSGAEKRKLLSLYQSLIGGMLLIGLRQRRNLVIGYSNSNTLFKILVEYRRIVLASVSQPIVQQSVQKNICFRKKCEINAVAILQFCSCNELDFCQLCSLMDGHHRILRSRSASASPEQFCYTSDTKVPSKFA